MISFLHDIIQEINRLNLYGHIICSSLKEDYALLDSLLVNCFRIVDDRSAGYVATGMSAEANAPVAIWCKGDLTFRELMPSLTEAYYRKLPILILSLKTGNSICQDKNPEDVIRYRETISSDINQETIRRKISYLVDLMCGEVVGPALLEVNFADGNCLADNSRNQYSMIPASVISMISQFPFNAKVFVGSIANRLDLGKKIQNYIYIESSSQSGKLSTMVGASMVDTKMYIGILTTEELVNDLNVVGNRHVDGNIIIIHIKESSETDLFPYFQKLDWTCEKYQSDEVLNFNYDKGTPQYIQIQL